jgi:hypothetical protein
VSIGHTFLEGVKFRPCSDPINLQFNRNSRHRRRPAIAGHSFCLGACPSLVASTLWPGELNGSGSAPAPPVFYDSGAVMLAPQQIGGRDSHEQCGGAKLDVSGWGKVGTAERMAMVDWPAPTVDGKTYLVQFLLDSIAWA